MTLKTLTVLGLVTASARLATAQCPDGTPPPCAGARVASRPASVPAASDRARRFLIIPFRNVTRQSDQDWLVEGSTTMLADALARWQGITVVPDEKLYPALKRAGISPGVVADETRLRRVAEETGGWTAVTGDIIATGGRVRVTARAWDVPTNRQLVRASSEVQAGGDVRQAFDSLSLRLLQSVGIDSGTTDLATITTRNLDAYRAYLKGLAHTRRGEVRSALAEFEESVRRDSTFALGWTRLAEMLNAMDATAILQPTSRAAQASARAVALSANLPPRKRALVLATNAQFRAQFTEARRLLEGVLKEDSTDVEALSALAGLEQFDPLLVDIPGGKRPRGTPQAAARYAKRVTQLDPSRHNMFGFLASMYANAGVPGVTPSVGIVREASGFPELMQMVQRRENVRLYYVVLRDSLVFVPAESLAAIPRDSLNAMRKAARAAARSWGEQWVAVAGRDQSMPHQLLAQLLGYDGEYAAALKELAAAESLGVQSPQFIPAARKLVFLAQSGDYTTASRIADSLTSAGFFANPTNLLYSQDAGIWAFALHLLRGRVTNAQTLLQQSMALRRVLSPSAVGSEFAGYATLMGTGDPEDEPRLSRRFRALMLDSVLVRLDAFVASPQLGPWMPLLLPMLVEAADSTKKSSARLLPVADALASKGHSQLAFYLAANATQADSTLEVAAARYAWYRTAAEAYNNAKRAVQMRFTPSSATVSAQQAVFEWQVNDSTPFTRNRAETPVGRNENRWVVMLEAGRRYYRLAAGSATKSASDAPSSGTLSDLLPPTASRTIVGGNLDAGVMRDTTLLQGVVLRTEVAPGVLRMIVNDQTIVGALLAARPTHATFRFEPCIVPVGTNGQRQCLEAKVPITYSP